MRNLLLKIATVTVAVLIGGLSATASKTYYAKATATASGAGTVYVSTSATSSPAYEATSSASNSTSTQNGNVTFYLYAQPGDGNEFLGWNTGGSIVSYDNPYQASVQATATDSNSPSTYSYTALFGEKPYVRVFSSDNDCGTAKISKVSNKAGDVVTLTAERAWLGLPDHFAPNFGIIFDGWHDELGNVLSRDLTYKFTVTEPIDITAVWHADTSVQSNSGYYRVSNMANEYLKVVGDESLNSSSVSNLSMAGLLEWLHHPLWYQYAYLTKNEKNENAFADPGIIIHISGTLNATNANTFKTGNAVLNNLVMTAQGVNTASLIQTSQSVTMTLQWADDPGRYRLYTKVGSTSGAFKWTWDDVVYAGKINNDSYDGMALQPVNEECVDTNWWGVFPAEEMMWDDGYWSTMYTSFPYKCYEPDGVEVYYISDMSAKGGEARAVITRIEDGVVPAETPVLLKCKRVIDTTAYFTVTGASPEPDNRLIPLEPSEELTERGAEIAAENMLRGEYQLRHSRSGDPGFTTFDPSHMRVLSVNDEGVMGFYSLTEGTELAANRAWLDVSSLPADVQKIRIVTEVTGEDGITTIENDTETSDCDTIYDLMGRRVVNPIPGTIYIRNGHKFIVR